MKLLCKKAGLGETGLEIVTGLADVSTVLERIFELTGGFKRDGVNRFKKVRSKVIVDGATCRWVVRREAGGGGEVEECSLVCEGSVESTLFLNEIGTMTEGEEADVERWSNDEENMMEKKRYDGEGAALVAKYGGGGGGGKGGGEGGGEGEGGKGGGEGPGKVKAVTVPQTEAKQKKEGEERAYFEVSDSDDDDDQEKGKKTKAKGKGGEQEKLASKEPKGGASAPKPEEKAARSPPGDPPLGGPPVIQGKSPTEGAGPSPPSPSERATVGALAGGKENAPPPRE